MTEKEKSHRGELYDPTGAELANDRERAAALCEEYNRTPRSETEKRSAILKSLLGKTGKNVTAESGVWFDYGYNTELGENFFCNHNCVFMDEAKIRIGDNAFIGPQCGFYTAKHPLDAETRNKGLEYAFPIAIGNNVWIGGGVTILPNVHIGDNCVIGAGSVVTKDIPANSVAVGNPAKVIKKI